MADHTPEDPNDRNAAITFVGFVLLLAHNAAVQFGDMPDPVTGQNAGANLHGAQHMIDILSLLEEKTRGNLSLEERQFLEQILFDLRMRYVEIDKSGTAGASASRIILP